VRPAESEPLYGEARTGGGVDGSATHRLASLAALLLGAVAAPPVAAHVDYVGPQDAAGSPSELFAAAAADPVGLTVLAVTGILVVGLGLAWRAWGERLTDVAVLRDVLEGYRDLVPWMIRLSVGLPLVGAGFAGYLITPALPIEVRILQVLIGFLLLLGLATRAAATVALAGWASVAMLYGPRLFLAGEFTGAFVALMLLGPGRPSVDDMLERLAEDPRTAYHAVDPVHELGQQFRGFVAPARRWAPVAVRVTLGLTFVYLGVSEKIARPGPAIALAEQLGLPGLVPMSAEAWVLAAGLVEAGVGVLLVLGLFTRAASAAAFLVLTVTLFALPNDPVLAHVSLFGLSSVVFTWGSGKLGLDPTDGL